MSTLNKAFIKAFAKDRTKASRPRAELPSVDEPIPEAPTPSVSLTLHDIYAEGDRFRIDGPPAVDQPAVPEAHLAFAPVHFVETYDPSDPHAVALDAVIVEDRTVDALEAHDLASMAVPTTVDDLVEPEALPLPGSVEAADPEIDAEIGASEIVEEHEAAPQPEIETTWGYDVGDDRPDIGQGASVEIADEGAGEETHVAVITPEMQGIEGELDDPLRALYGVEFGLPASTDLGELKPGSFPVSIPQWPAATPATQDEPLPSPVPDVADPTTSDNSVDPTCDDAVDGNAPPPDDARRCGTNWPR